MRFKQIALIAVPVLALGGLIFWRIQTKSAAASQLSRGARDRTGAAMPVKLYEAKPGVILSTLELTGQIESPYVVKLAAKTSGRIDFLEVREGSPVKPGQVLVKLDPTSVEGEILSSQSNLAAAKSRLAQARISQSATNTGVKAQVRKDQAGLTSSVADFQQTKDSAAQQIAVSESAVADGNAKVSAAKSQLAAAESDVNSDKANLVNTKAKFDRMESLFKQGFTSAQEVDNARAALSVAEATVLSSQNKVQAAKSAVVSAEAQLEATKRQSSITKNKSKSDIAAAQARLEQARATLDVSDANTSQIGAYQQNLSALQEAVTAAQGQLSQSLSKRADTQLSSLIEGVVTERTMDPGTTASPGAPILTIQFLKWLYVSVPVPVESSARVHVGDAVNFKVDGIDNEFTGKVAEINPAADPQSRQFTVRLKIENPDGVLRPGMYAHVKLQIGRVDAAIAAPREAVSTNATGVSTAFIVDEEGKAKRVTVEVGAMSANMVEIKSGVTPGQKLIILSTRPPRDGQAVTDADKAPRGGAGGTGEGKGSRGGRSRS